MGTKSTDSDYRRKYLMLFKWIYEEVGYPFDSYIENFPEECFYDYAVYLAESDSGIIPPEDATSPGPAMYDMAASFMLAEIAISNSRDALLEKFKNLL